MGPFKTLNEILEVDGLGEMVLLRIFNQILGSGETSFENTAKGVKEKPRRRKQFIMPHFDLDCVSHNFF